MAYFVTITCDICGQARRWEGRAVGKVEATRIARDLGWQVGKSGWFCYACLKETKLRRKDK